MNGQEEALHWQCKQCLRLFLIIQLELFWSTSILLLYSLALLISISTNQLQLCSEISSESPK